MIRWWRKSEGMDEVSKILWEQIEPVLRPHATVANGRELHWIGWCWQILDHQGLTTYGSEPEKAMVLMRALALMRVQQDYAYIMLDIDQTLKEAVVFNELCKATGCAEKATLLWEHKRIMSVLVDAYVEWNPLVPTYDPALADEYGWSVYEVLEDLNKTLPPESKEEFVYAMHPEGFSRAVEKIYDGESESLKDFHEWLDRMREAHIDVWLENDWVLTKTGDSYDEGVRLYFHASWDEVEPFFRGHLCWDTAEEIDWYKEMWGALQNAGYTGYRFEFAEVAEAMIRLVHAYQSFCSLALDRPIAIELDPELDGLTKAAVHFEQEPVLWEPNTLVPALVGILANSEGYRRPGRFGRLQIDQAQAFLRRAVATLPITDKSLARHYEAETAWRFDGPPGVDPKTYNAELFKRRMDNLNHWLKHGTIAGNIVH